MFSFNRIAVAVIMVAVGFGGYMLGAKDSAAAHQNELVQQRIRFNEDSHKMNLEVSTRLTARVNSANEETTLFYKESNKYAKQVGMERDLAAAITALAARAAEGDNSDVQVALFRVEMALHALGRDGDVSAFRRLRERLNDQALLKDKVAGLQQEVLDAIGDRFVNLKIEDLK